MEETRYNWNISQVAEHGKCVVWFIYVNSCDAYIKVFEVNLK